MKKTTRLRLTSLTAMILCAALLMTSVCGCGKNSDSGNQAEQIITLSESDEGYDIVLALDESSSISTHEKQFRNQASHALVTAVSDNCRLGTVFFSSGINAGYDMLSMSKEKNRKRFLQLFDADKGRMNSADDGTDLGLTLQRSFKMLGTSEREKAIFLFTDGVNYISNGENAPDVAATKKADEFTRQQVQKACTFSNGTPVPIYVIYLDDHSRNKKNEGIDHLLDLMSTSDRPAVLIDVKDNSLENWSGLAWSGICNRIIRVDNPAMLPTVFTRILYKLKNVGLASFSAEPDEERTIPVGFTVPDFAVKKIQISVFSEKPFTIDKAGPVDGENYIPKKVRCAGGRLHMIDIPDYTDEYIKNHFKDGENNGILTPGMWQMDITGSAAVSGTVACYADFSASAVFRQQSPDGALHSGSDMTVSLSLTGSSGSEIHIPKGTTARLICSQNGKTASCADLSKDGDRLTADSIRLEKAGEYDVCVEMSYWDMLFTASGTLTIAEGLSVSADTVDETPEKRSKLPILPILLLILLLAAAIYIYIRLLAAENHYPVGSQNCNGFLIFKDGERQYGCAIPKNTGFFSLADRPVRLCKLHAESMYGENDETNPMESVCLKLHLAGNEMYLSLDYAAAFAALFAGKGSFGGLSGFLCKRASESCEDNGTSRKFPVEQGETYTVLYDNREYTLILCDNGWNELFIKNI